MRHRLLCDLASKRLHKMIGLALLGGLLLLGEPVPIKAQTLAQTRAVVDARLANLWDVILLRQTIHYINYGTYFQGMITHLTIPTDGQDIYPDNYGARPTDQKTNWIDFWDTAIPQTLPMALVIDTYDGPEGKGFTATVYVYYQGILYSRSKSTGPEGASRTKGWHTIP